MFKDLKISFLFVVVIDVDVYNILRSYLCSGKVQVKNYLFCSMLF